jgi:hypothetical protein
MKLTLSDALILFVVALSATVIGNLIVAKIVSDQASASLNGNPLLRLFSAAQ